MRSKISTSIAWSSSPAVRSSLGSTVADERMTNEVSFCSVDFTPFATVQRHFVISGCCGPAYAAPVIPTDSSNSTAQSAATYFLQFFTGSLPLHSLIEYTYQYTAIRTKKQGTISEFCVHGEIDKNAKGNLCKLSFAFFNRIFRQAVLPAAARHPPLDASPAP